MSNSYINKKRKFRNIHALNDLKDLTKYEMNKIQTK